jgi:hypothetical protein
MHIVHVTHRIWPVTGGSERHGLTIARYQEYVREVGFNQSWDQGRSLAWQVMQSAQLLDPHQLPMLARVVKVSLGILVQHLSRLVSDRELRSSIGEAARMYVEAHCHPAVAAERYASFIKTTVRDFSA